MNTTRMTKNSMHRKPTTSKIPCHYSTCKQLDHNVRWCPKCGNQWPTIEGSGVRPQKHKRAKRKPVEVLGVHMYAYRTFTMNLVYSIVSN